jgi:hypothetical protein
MQAERVVSARSLEGARSGPTLMKIVFGVRLDPADGGAFVDQRLVMNRPKADPGTRRNRLREHTS